MTQRVGRLGWADIARAPEAAAWVLVVDDEAPLRSGLERLLVRFGYQVKTAASAEEADAWLGSQKFDALLLDIELPRMKGIEFLRWTLEREPEMAVIMLTGLDDPKLAMECLREGARTYLVKPIEAEFLRVALRDAIAMRRLLEERNRAAE
jgi:DNA-binding NtrC family response regulator